MLPQYHLIMPTSKGPFLPFPPSITNGDLNMLVATKKSRQTYWDIPLVHPDLRRAWQAMQDDDRCD
jgi:hypothetical protein